MTSPQLVGEQLWRKAFNAVINADSGAIQDCDPKAEVGVQHGKSKVQKQIQRSIHNPVSVG